MPNRFRVYLFTAMLAMFATSIGIACAEESKKNNAWAGYPIGSWVIYDTHQGDSKRKITSKQKLQITAIEKGVLKGTMQIFSNDKWGAVNQRSFTAGKTPTEDGMIAVESVEENLTIDGKTFRCTKTTFESKDKKQNSQTQIVVWKTDDLKIHLREIPILGPKIALGSNVVRARYTKHNPDNKSNFRLEVKLASIKAVEFQVNNENIPCTKETFTAEGTIIGREVNFSGFRLWSDRVPGKLIQWHHEFHYDKQKSVDKGHVSEFSLAK